MICSENHLCLIWYAALFRIEGVIKTMALMYLLTDRQINLCASRILSVHVFYWWEIPVGQKNVRKELELAYRNEGQVLQEEGVFQGTQVQGFCWSWQWSETRTFKSFVSLFHKICSLHNPSLPISFPTSSPFFLSPLCLYFPPPPPHTLFEKQPPSASMFTCNQFNHQKRDCVSGPD